jgi:hypothetical protein
MRASLLYPTKLGLGWMQSNGELKVLNTLFGDEALLAAIFHNEGGQFVFNLVIMGE